MKTVFGIVVRKISFSLTFNSVLRKEVAMSNKFKTTLMLLCAIVATLCLVSCSNENPAPTRKVEMRRPTPQKDFDKYTFIDAMGVKYTLTLKDAIAILEYQSGSETTTNYGKCEFYREDEPYIMMWFSSGDHPHVAFSSDHYETTGIVLNEKDRFLYADRTAFKVKNPNLRLEVIKVE